MGKSEKMKKDNNKEIKDVIKEEKKITKENKKNTKKTENKKVDTNTKTKNVKDGKNINMKRTLSIILYILIIVLISLVSFVGIYVKNTNKMSNIVSEYALGTDIYGARNVVLKVNTATETKTYDTDGNITEDTTAENVTTEEVPINSSDVLTLDNYKKVKQIIIDRLDYMNVGYYEIKCNEADGTIYLEIPENTNTDYITQYSVTKGSFELKDSDSGEVLLTNKNIKEAKVQYSTTTTGTTVFLTIEFDKEGKEILKEISTNSSENEKEEAENESEENDEIEDSETEETSREVTLTLDGETIIKSDFEDPITDGIIQLSLGTSQDTEQINSNLQQASNIAVFLNSESMPITYEIETNRFVFSDVTIKTLGTIIIVAAIVFVLMLIYMIIKYKKLGALGAITTIGFVAILLMAIRYANVTITGTGLVSIGLAALFEYLAFMQLFNVNSKDLDNETKQKEIKRTIIRQIETMIPLVIITIVFAVAKWQPLYSMGMILFWGVLTALLYNCITIRIMIPKEKIK